MNSQPRYRTKNEGYLPSAYTPSGVHRVIRRTTGQVISTTNLYYSITANTRWNGMIERCHDVNHGRRDVYDVGGAFDKWSVSDYGTELKPWSVSYHDPYIYAVLDYEAEGASICGLRPSQVYSAIKYNAGNKSDAPTNSFGAAETYGPAAWNKFKPGKPQSDMGLFFAELKEAPRMIVQSLKYFLDVERTLKRSGRLRAMSRRQSSEYLNINFGWFPFLSDVRSFYRTCTRLDESVRQIKRDNGQWVKRTGTVEEGLTTDSFVYSSTVSAAAPSPSTVYLGSPTGRTTIASRVVSSVWFSGRFRYWIPDISSGKTERRILRKLYGLDLTPSLVWNLIPFSWLADWVSNVGDNISNITNGWAENLVAKYAYVMRRLDYEAVVKSTWHTKQCGDINLTHRYGISRRNRVAASPFGFNLDASDFSGRQTSLLAALGLSRLKYGA